MWYTVYRSARQENFLLSEAHLARARQYMSQIHTSLDLPERAADRNERSPGQVEGGGG